MKDQGNTSQNQLAISPLIFPVHPPVLQPAARNELFDRLEHGMHTMKRVVCSANFLRHVLYLLGPAAVESMSVFVGAVITIKKKKEDDLDFDPKEASPLTHALGWQVGALSGALISLFIYVVSAYAYCRFDHDWEGLRRFSYWIGIIYSVLSLPVASLILGHPELMEDSLVTCLLGLSVLAIAFVVFAIMMAATFIAVVSCCCLCIKILPPRREQNSRQLQGALNNSGLEVEVLKSEDSSSSLSSSSFFSVLTRKNRGGGTRRDENQFPIANEEDANLNEVRGQTKSYV